MENKKILYIDMDGVIADFDKVMKTLIPDVPLGEGENYEERSKMVDKAAAASYPTLFEDLELMEGAKDAVEQLKDKYEIYFLSTPMWAIPQSYMGKRIWIQRHFGEWANKRLILTHRKDLCIGDYLVDDRLKNGSESFTGQHLHFGNKAFPNWEKVTNFLINN